MDRTTDGTIQSPALDAGGRCTVTTAAAASTGPATKVVDGAPSRVTAGGMNDSLLRASRCDRRVRAL